MQVGEAHEGRERGLKAQAGKGLCVSETVYPGGSRHSVSLVYGGTAAGADSGRGRDMRSAGGEFVDLQAGGTVVAFTAWTDGRGKYSESYGRVGADERKR